MGSPRFPYKLGTLLGILFDVKHLLERIALDIGIGLLGGGELNLRFATAEGEVGVSHVGDDLIATLVFVCAYQKIGPIDAVDGSVPPGYVILRR